MSDTVTFDATVLAEIAELELRATATFTSAALRAIVRAGVFDAIGDEPRHLPELAASTAVDLGALRRVLRFLEPAGYVSIDDNAVRATPRTRLYKRDSPLWASIAHLGSSDIAHALDHSLRTGGSAWEHVHDATFFDWLSADPEQEAVFATAMRNEGRVLNVVATPWIDLSGVDVVADIGGGTGDLLMALLALHPQVHGVLVDLPSVLARAEIDEARCTLHPGDLFGTMPSADAYVLARVLHDWSDDDCIRILRTIRAAASPGALLFDIDLVVPSGAEPHAAKLSDIGMLLLFGGGRERTHDEFHDLFASTGWRLERTTELPHSSLLVATAVE